MFGRTEPVCVFRGPLDVRVEIAPSLIFLVLLILGLAGPENFAISATYLLMLIGSLYAHELGHAWAAQLQSIEVERIVLGGGGGYCELKHTADPREDELIVAVGPLVNLTIWAFAGLMAAVSPHAGVQETMATLSAINLFLALFNLMPVMPLDGGRLLHLGLLRALPEDAAARITGAVGLAVTFLWVPVAIHVWAWWGFMLLFIPSVPFQWQILRGAYR